MINSQIYNVVCLHIPCHENKDPGKSMFSFSIYLHHYHECHANTLELPNNNGLKQSSYISAISSSAQLHIPYCKNKKCMKAKINFFHFSSICSTTNEYHENKDPTSELHHLHLHPFFIIVITLPHTTLILALQNDGFKHKHRT